MKVLILSCHMGDGHNSAGLAVREALLRHGDSAEMLNVLTVAGKRPTEIADKSYTSIVTHIPALFGIIYKAGDLYNRSILPSPIYHANAVYADRLERLIIEGGFEAVVSTHVFAMEAITAIRRKHKPSFGAYNILTDYTCSPFFDEADADAYFTPHTSVTDLCIRRKMPADRLISSGIPVSLRFTRHTEKNVAREQLGIPQDSVCYLIMTGGLGCGHTESLCSELIRRGGKNAYIAVLTGRNEQLKDEMTARFQSQRVKIQGYTNRVDLYMSAADVVLTKPGGISSTEAAVARVPIIHTMPIPGCESENAKLFSRLGMSIRAKNTVTAAESAVRLASDSFACERMRTMQGLQINPNAAEDIVQKITGK